MVNIVHRCGHLVGENRGRSSHYGTSHGFGELGVKKCIVSTGSKNSASGRTEGLMTSSRAICWTMGTIRIAQTPRSSDCGRGRRAGASERRKRGPRQLRSRPCASFPSILALSERPRIDSAPRTRETRGRRDGRQADGKEGVSREFITPQAAPVASSVALGSRRTAEHGEKAREGWILRREWRKEAGGTKGENEQRIRETGETTRLC